MLRKVLKYDLSAIYKLWLILSATALGLSVLCGLFIRSLVLDSSDAAIRIFFLLGAMLCIFGIMAYVIGVSITVIVRYYTNFFTDEGYLTFTLPVKRHILFNSKLLNAFIWDILTGAVTVICVIIILAISPENAENECNALTMIIREIPEVFPYISMILEQIWGWAIAYSVVAVLAFLASYVFKTVAIYCCITVGCVIVKKHKVLAAVGILYLGSSLLSMLSYGGTILLSFGISAINASGIYYTSNQIALMLLLVMLAAVMLTVIVSALIYKFTVSRIRGNLNLA